MPPSEPWRCERCAADWPHEGFREYFVPFGQTQPVKGCRACLCRDLTQPEVRANTVAAYGLDRGRLAAMTFDTFKPLTPHERAARTAAQKLVQYWQAGDSKSIWFWSPIYEPPETQAFAGRQLIVSGCGTGKTHLAVALAKAALDLGHTLKLVQEKDLFDDIRASYDDRAERTEQQIISDLCAPWLLVLDDVGTADVKSLGWYQAIIGGVIDARYKAKRPLVLTTNLAPVDFDVRIGPRAASRLADMGAGFLLDGPDRRRMKG